MKDVKIKEHGKYYIPKKANIFCPECSYTLDINDYAKSEDSNWEFLTIFRVKTIEVNCECPNCDCKFDATLEKKIVEIDWEILLPLILLFVFVGLTVLGVVFLCTHHYVAGAILTIAFSICTIIDIGVLVG